MKQITEHIRARILSGIDSSPVGDKTESLQVLRMSERCARFEELRMNRKIVGRFRYGLMGRTTNAEYEWVAAMLRRIGQYQEDGNKEHLVDVANLCEIEFVRSKHPLAHFAATDDGDHVDPATKHHNQD